MPSTMMRPDKPGNILFTNDMREFEPVSADQFAASVGKSKIAPAPVATAPIRYAAAIPSPAAVPNEIKAPEEISALDYSNTILSRRRRSSSNQSGRQGTLLGE